MRQVERTGTCEEHEFCLLASREVCLQMNMSIVLATFEHTWVEALGESEDVTA